MTWCPNSFFLSFPYRAGKGGSGGNGRSPPAEGGPAKRGEHGSPLARKGAQPPPLVVAFFFLLLLVVCAGSSFSLPLEFAMRSRRGSRRGGKSRIGGVRL